MGVGGLTRSRISGVQCATGDRQHHYSCHTEAAQRLSKHLCIHVGESGFTVQNVRQCIFEAQKVTSIDLFYMSNVSRHPSSAFLQKQRENRTSKDSRQPLHLRS